MSLHLRRRSLARHCGAAATLALAACAHAAPMGVDDARHLLARAGFGGTPSEIAEFAGLSHEQAVERLLDTARTSAVTPPPAWVNDPPTPLRELRRLAPEERKSFIRDEIRKGIELRAWWIGEMLATPSPLTERMVLFWHNHFTSGQQKVRFAQLLYRQNVLLRRQALGNFATLLHAVAKDPAMILWLDSASNRKDHPNENFAREVMELFTLGEGRYGERDVREAARAFTGWSLDPDTLQFRFRPFVHDGGEKTVLGHSGALDGDQVLDILLAQPACAEFIVAKLWREFVSSAPDPREVSRIADRFRDSGYDIRTALREIFLSSAFWAPRNRGVLVKSPVDLVVGTLRQFEFQSGDPLPFAFAVARLGQNLFSPPSVKGWPGGEAWINTATLLARKQLLDRLFRAQEMPRSMALGRFERDPGAAAPAAVALAAKNPLAAQMREQALRALGSIRFDAARWFGELQAERLTPRRVLLALDPVRPPPERAAAIEQLRALVLDPVYQLR